MLRIDNATYGKLSLQELSPPPRDDFQRVEQVAQHGNST
jgi:hypothetical protein